MVDYKQTGKILKIPFNPSTLETIDTALFNFINERVRPSSTTNKGFKKVPIIWAGKERSAINKDDPELRNSTKRFILPVITIRRTNKQRNVRSKGVVYADLPPEGDKKGGVSSLVIAREINQDKTGNFANADAFRKLGVFNFPRKNEKVVYETITIPAPSYLEVNYEIKIEAEYQQQMNEIVQPFINGSGVVSDFFIEHDGHRYEAFYDETYSEDNNLNDFSKESRKFETIIGIRVYGYLISAGNNEDRPYIVVRENFVDVKIPREYVVTEAPNVTGGIFDFHKKRKK